MTREAEALMRSIIERIATGPEMSKNISRSDAREGMAAVLDRQVGDVQAALFLIALRMKRETDDENRGVFEALASSTVSEAVAVDELLTISDPFNGFNRGLPMSPFLPAVLAACGVPCLSTGVETVAPKFGLTHHHVLSAAARAVDLPAGRAAAQVAAPDIGWAYLDQSVTAPKLFRLGDLRRQIVKRQLLSTCEVLLRPLTARRRNVACIGYVHANYPRVYAMLAQLAGYDTAIIVKGVEGGIIPSLQAGSKLYRAAGGEPAESVSVNPAAAGIRDAPARAITMPFDDLRRNAERTVELGLAALGGEPGAARDSLVYGAAIAQFGADMADSLESGARTARRALDSGEARERFEKAA